MTAVNSYPDFIVTLPPPTPNGGLHVGHMAGPFLAADVFTKAVQALGKSVHVLSYSDTNQSYVRVTAEKQNRDPVQLASYWANDIHETLNLFCCQINQYFELNIDTNKFVRDLIYDLYDKNILKKKSYPFLYLPDQEVFLDEAGACGHCPRCLDDCKCGICEACGHLTQANTLLNPWAAEDSTARVEVRHADVLVLELESWRAALRDFHRFSDAIRPKYRWLVNDVLAEPLPDFPITVPGCWGIGVDHSELPGQVVNAWPEIALNFVYGYRRVKSSDGAPPQIVNFFGYDNSYFYAIVHVALLCAAGMEQYLPRATIINEFYNLENKKFSTSRDHLIWARDMAQTYPPDLVRFYAALSAPGFEQGNFNETDMREIVTRRLILPYNRIVNTARQLNNEGDTSESVEKMKHALSKRMAFSFDIDRLNLRQAAEDGLRGLCAIESVVAAHATNRRSLIELLKTWACAMTPLMPSVSGNLLQELKVGRIPDAFATWPADVPCEMQKETANV